ncbi:MAG: family 10 glycosylhydrolase [Burkholderiales bacterium]
MTTWNRRRMLGAAGAATLVAAGLEACVAPMTSLQAATTKSAPELDALAPPAPREFRAAWVATVANIDWPSRKGLSSAQQQAEMQAILNQAAALQLNALILQIRTHADALYSSPLEPWSEYLSGTQGQTPEPFYDPLALWIEQAHARGLELHAWFNPFRARLSQSASKPAANHLSQTQPAWVKPYGEQLWIDPGESAAADHTMAVLMDVLQRYDVDGIHLDDYFYPYPVTLGNESKVEVDFPDQSAWQRYVDGGGNLARNDWRRANVDALIQRMHAGIRSIKPWVRFGVSPFGLGRPELRPSGIQGFSQYHKLYADVERWLQQGWMDYLVPQLYWRMDQTAQAFVPLLDYWHTQNPHKRNIFAGLFTSKIAASDADAKAAWSPEEIVNQIATVRSRAPGSGHVHFSMVALMQNRQGVADTLRTQTYRTPALVPASPWLESGTPDAPLTELRLQPSGALELSMRTPPSGKPVARWAVWLRFGEQWAFQVCMQPTLSIPAVQAGIAGAALTGIVVSALDRVGNESPRVGLIPLPPMGA